MYGKRPPNPRFLLLLIGVAAVAGVFFFNTHTDSVISPIPEEPVVRQTILSNIFTRKKKPDDLKDKIQRAIDNQWSNYSVYVVDYTSTFTMGINETVIYNGASVNKILILAALYDYAKQGEVDFDKTITPQQDDIQDYGTGSIRYDPPGTAYSIKTLARLMMQKSDNTAAYVIANHVMGLTNIQQLVSGWGLTQTDMIKNTTSNRDMELLMRKIVDGKIVGTSLTEEMLGFMKDSDFENRIPGDLPSGVTVYHKTGDGDNGEIHDVGIVTHGNTAYYIGILTSNAGDPEAASKLEAKISKIVYDFLR